LAVNIVVFGRTRVADEIVAGDGLMALPDYVWLALDPMDMRSGIDDLSSRTQKR